MFEIILATSNAGKIKELSILLSPISCIAQDQLGVIEAEETGLSFIENALIKARNASLQTNKAALADDSGLVVDALMGAPGIYSARFAGKNASDAHNMERLLNDMHDIPEARRDAYFFCAIAIVRYPCDPTPLIATGKVEGRIAMARSGQEGFGYDPIFYLPEKGCTMAQLPADVKHQISHRAHALRALRQQLELLCV